MKLGSNIT